MNKEYAGYVGRLQKQHGDKFDPSSLAKPFADHFGHRVEVDFGDGIVKRGWVTGTTGWRPSLMILLRRNSHGSSWLVKDSDKLLRVLDQGPR